MKHRKTNRRNRSRRRGLRVPRMELLEARTLLAADVFEPNDSFDKATDLGSGDQLHQDLTIDPSGDVDYYRWHATADGVLDVQILFQDVAGDLELELFNDGPTRIGKSFSLDDNERIVQPVIGGQNYYVRVKGFGGDTNTYDLVMDGPGQGIGEDAFEPNNSFDDASDLGIGDQILGNLTIHSVFDEDFYTWSVIQDGILNVDVLFNHAGGNVDLEVYDGDQKLVDSSTSETDNESITRSVFTGEKYFFRIFTPGFENQDDYTLIIDGPVGGVPVDNFEPNDSFAEAAPLPPGDQTLLGLTIHEPLNEDWYRWKVPADGEATFNVFFNHGVANIDVEAYDANQTLLARSESETNNEQIVLDDAEAGDDIIIRVYQVGFGAIQSYNISIDGPEVLPDRLEPNDSFGLPTDLGTLTDQTIEELSIHQSTVFEPVVLEVRTGSSGFPAVNELQSITILPQGSAGKGTFRVSISTTQTGSLDSGPLPFDANGSAVGAALNNAYGKTVFSVTGPAKGPYNVEFIGDLGGKDIKGLFNVDVSQLSRTDASNDDFFKWTAIDNGTLVVDAIFRHDLGNVDVQLLDAVENVIASSTSTTDNERISYSVVAGEKYVIRVFGANGQLNSNYTLAIDGPGIGPDQFEPNNDSSVAADLGAGDQTHSHLTVHRAFDPDWYAFRPAMSGNLEVSIAYDASLGDLELELYNVDLSLLDGSYTRNDEEVVSYNVDAGETYLIHVYGFGSSVQPNYSLSIDGPGPNQDPFESNDDMNGAHDLGVGDQDQPGLTIHVEDNEDWYKWTASAAGTMTVDVLFMDLLGDVNLEVYDAEQNLLGSSLSTTDNEQVVLDVTAGQVVFVRVFGVGGVLQDNYELKITGNDPPTISEIEDQVVDEDASVPPIVFSFSDDETPADSLTVDIMSSNTDLLPLENITVETADLDGEEETRSLKLVPVENRSGTTTVTITVTDTDGASTSEAFKLTVEGLADAPNLAVSNAAGVEDAAIPLKISSSLIDVDGSETLSIEITDVPSGATLSAGTPFASSSWRLTPDELAGLTITPPAHDASGFVLTVRGVATEDNGDVAATTAGIQIDITPVADPPELKVSDAAGDEDMAIPLFITSTLTDLDGSETLETVISGVPAGAVLSAGTDNGDGSWTVTEEDLNGLTITPPENDSRDMSLVITATATELDNGDKAVSTATLAVTVGAANDNPTVSDTADLSTPEDTPTGPISVTVNDQETAADALTVSVTSDNETLVPAANIVVGGTGSERTLTLTPDQDQTGTATITVTVDDGEGGSATDTFVLTVTEVNDDPTISAIDDQTTPEETPAGPISFTVGDVESPADALTVTGTSDNQAMVPDANIVLGGAGSERTVTITPLADQIGRVNISLAVEDEHGGVATTTFQLEIGDVNDPPTISDISDQTVPEDTPTDAISFVVDDMETPAAGLTVSGTSDNQALIPDANLVFGGAGGNRTLTITPAQDQSGSATISVTVTDEGGATATDTFVVEVVSVNDDPVIAVVLDQVTDEDTPAAVSPLTITDVDSETLTVTVTSNNQTLVPNANIAVGAGAEHALTITPAVDQTGTAALTITARDDAGGIATTTFNLLVQAVNDPPVNSLPSDPQVTAEDTPLTFSVANQNALTVMDVDANEVLVVVSVDDGALSLAGGNASSTLTLRGPIAAVNGALNGLTYTPPADFHGTTTLSMVTNDLGNSGRGGELGDTDLLTIEVTPVNDPPVITSSDTVNVPEDTTAVLTLTATDADGDTPTFVLSGGADVALFAVNNITGRLSFVVAPDFEAPGDADGDNVYEVELTAADGKGGSATQLVRATVTDVSDDVTAPTVEVAEVAPNPRAASVSEISITFSEPVSGLDMGDLALSRSTDDTVNVSLDQATLTTADDVHWTLGNLAGLTRNSGIYELSLNHQGSAIADLFGNPLASGDAIHWVNGAGDANLDNEFDQTDLVLMLQSGKYVQDVPATWSEGDFDGNGRFDQFDIIMIQTTMPLHYLAGPIAAVAPAVDAPPAAASAAVDRVMAESAAPAADRGVADTSDGAQAPVEESGLGVKDSDSIADLIYAAVAAVEDGDEEELF